MDRELSPTRFSQSNPFVPHAFLLLLLLLWWWLFMLKSFLTALVSLIGNAGELKDRECRIHIQTGGHKHVFQWILTHYKGNFLKGQRNK